MSPGGKLTLYEKRRAARSERVRRCKHALEQSAPGGSKMLKSDYEQAMEVEFANGKEAWALLDLINAEFQSDPTSTQCFDLRIVRRVKDCIDKHRAFQKKWQVEL